MAKTARTRNRKLLLILLIIVVVLAAMGCVLFWTLHAPASTQPSSESSPSSQVPAPSQEWQAIDSLPDYQGMLDSPMTELNLAYYNGSPYSVSCADEDILQTWSRYLSGLEVQQAGNYSQEELTQYDGTPPPRVTVKTENGEYVLRFNREGEQYQLMSSEHYYALSAPESFPFEETYQLAAQRHEEVFSTEY